MIKALGTRADAAGRGLYNLTFMLELPSADRFFLASSIPYTYSDLQQYLLSLAVSSAALGLDCSGSRIVRRSLLCRSEGGNRCDLLTVTDFEAGPDVVAARPVVFMTARIHPGETAASWVMQVRSCL